MILSLKEQELNFNKIIENSREGILIVDTDGMVLFANPAAHILLDQKSGTLVGKLFGRPLEDGKSIQLGIVRLNERVGVGEMRLRDTDWGGKKAHLVLLMDITELKRVQEDLQKMNDELEIRVEERTSEILRSAEKLKDSNAHLLKANAELETFAFIASHDLQEPLRKILIYGDRLEASAQLDPKCIDDIKRMTRSANNLFQLVEGLLQFSRLPHEFRMEPCDLNDIMKDVIELKEIKIFQTRAVVSYAGLPTLWANKAQMTHLFKNLIGNSIKFAQKGVSAVILVASKVHPDGVEISIADNGIGVDEKYAGKIFEAFQRLHSKSEYEGSGVGLSIVKKIVENHQGTIRVERADPSGCIFTITLPLNVMLPA